MKKGLFVLGICMGLICSGLFVSNASADSTATISVTIYRILKIDEIENAWLLQGEADWFYHVGVSEDGGNTFTWQHSAVPIQQDKDDLTVNKIHTFSGIKSATVTIAIMLCEDDTGSSDIADISSDTSGGYDGRADSIQPPATSHYGGTYIGYYNLKTTTNPLSGDTTYIEEGYRKTSGDYDGSTSIDQNDATVWFNIDDNYDAPVAVINTGGYSFYTYDKINFNGAGSTASAGSSITRYQWDFESDGVWDIEGATTSNTYNTKGTYIATLKVTDSLGETNTKTSTLDIKNSLPTAAFASSPSNPTTLDTIYFTDTSTDKDGTIASWAWVFGDGQTSSQSSPTHEYTSGGTYTVSLTVTDNNGGIDTESKSISVIELATVSGTVKDSKGNPISGATVSVYTGGTTTLIKSTTTDSSGGYTASSIATGTYDIEASSSGYNNNKVTGKYISSGTNTNDFVLTSSGGGSTPGFETVSMIVALGIVAVLLIRRKKTR